MYFIQSTVELGAQEAWPINVLPRWLTVTVQHKINCNNIMYVVSYISVTNKLSRQCYFIKNKVIHSYIWRHRMKNC